MVAEVRAYGTEFRRIVKSGSRIGRLPTLSERRAVISGLCQGRPYTSSSSRSAIRIQRFTFFQLSVAFIDSIACPVASFGGAFFCCAATEPTASGMEKVRAVAAPPICVVTSTET